ncbi:hypothetical protein GCM10023322_46060 [Rugosimonospora acidiphila]|uniref:F5/8 type C domain-containing protein n=2 Tax=Rugosimonospora acidiphila TaxID=556531 RepID=A0ABP9S4X0_9ACTN
MGAIIAGTTLLAAGVVGLTAAPAFAAATGGVGATLPYVEVQAENSATNGTIIGPSADYGTLPDEASYRKAVTLQGSGKYVEFTTPAPTNSIDFRYSIPDSSGGSVYTAPLSLYVNGTKQTNFTLTNAYSWYYGGYPFTNSPGSNPHHFYDEVHRLFTTTYPAGTKFRLQVDSEDTAGSYTIDFADFENVAGDLAQPSGSVSVTSEGADPTGVNDSTAAFNAAIAAAGSGGTVWIPDGTFKIPGHLILNNITIKGAGMWHSTITGDAPGFYGGYVPNGGSNVHLSDFAIFGNVQERNDSAQVNGIGGALSNSTVDRIWIEHEKVGAWMDGPMTNLVFTGMRIRDVTADGINFHNGVTSSRVTNSDIRNTGDDGLATWADTNADANDSFDHDTVQYPILANGIAIYGGHDNTVSDNRVIDAGLTQGGGIHVAQRFASTPLGKTSVLRNTLIRDGSLDPNWQFGVGALWFDARDAAINAAVSVDNVLIQQSPYEAIQFVSGSNISGVTINNATIQNTGTYVVQEQVGGAATITNSTATGTQAPQAIYNCGVGFTLTDGGGNSGITGSQCGFFTPTFPPYLPDNGSLVSISPTAVGFGTVATGNASAAQSVTVTNSGTAAAPVTSIATTGDFSQTNTCGSSIPAGSSCTVAVTFRPTAAGSRTGTLTVTTSGIANSIPLSGTGVAPGPILSANPSALSFPGTLVGATSAAQSVTVTNTGTTSASVSGVAASGDFHQTNTCGSLAVGASCTVTVTFTPTASGTRTGTVSITSNANNSPTAIAASGAGIGTTTNLAAGRPATASSQVNSTQAAGTATDGDANTYWESANGAFPQWLQVDLGAAYNLGKVTLKLPPSTAWATRTQTLSVQTSTNGSAFSTAVNSATYTFNPATGNTVSITVPGTSARYVRVNITANSGWSAGQVSEFEVYPSGGGTPPTSAALSANPSSLSFASQALNTTSAAQSVTVSNTGTAAATVSGVSVTGDFSQTNTCGTSIAAGASCTVSVAFHPTASGTRTGTLTVASNATNSPTTVALSGTGAGTTSTNLAAGRPTSESSHTDVYPSSNVTDGNQNTYWESANNAFPQWVQVDLGSAVSASRIVLQLPASWGARSETLSVLGSTNGSTFSTVKASAGYTFAPTANNTVTITFTATTQRYFRLNLTANTGWPAGQLSEFQVWNS